MNKAALKMSRQGRLHLNHLGSRGCSNKHLREAARRVVDGNDGMRAKEGAHSSSTIGPVTK